MRYSPPFGDWWEIERVIQGMGGKNGGGFGGSVSTTETVRRGDEDSR